MKTLLSAVFAWLVLAVVNAAINFESDGKAVNVDLLYTVTGDKPILADGFLGVPGTPGESGDVIALIRDDREYQFLMPAGLSVAKGDIIYVTLASVASAHEIPDAAYSTSAGAGKRAFAQATAAKDDNDVVTAVLLSGAV